MQLARAVQAWLHTSNVIMVLPSIHARLSLDVARRRRFVLATEQAKTTIRQANACQLIFVSFARIPVTSFVYVYLWQINTTGVKMQPHNAPSRATRQHQQQRYSEHLIIHTPLNSTHCSRSACRLCYEINLPFVRAPQPGPAS